MDLSFPNLELPGLDTCSPDNPDILWYLLGRVLKGLEIQFALCFPEHSIHHVVVF